MARFSTGLRNALASNYGLGLVMNGGVIRVYGGTRPNSPNNPPGTNELAQITTEGKTFVPGNDAAGAGLMLTVLSPGLLTGVGEWRLKAGLLGAATWWRWCWGGSDPLTESTYYPRVDGVVGTELVLLSTGMYVGLNTPIEQFLFTLTLGT